MTTEIYTMWFKDPEPVVWGALDQLLHHRFHLRISQCIVGVVCYKHPNNSLQYGIRFACNNKVAKQIESRLGREYRHCKKKAYFNRRYTPVHRPSNFNYIPLRDVVKEEAMLSTLSGYGYVDLFRDETGRLSAYNHWH